MLWSPIYETGIPVVDAQHKELFRQIEILLDKSKADRTKKTLDFLGSYVVKHFTTEEGLQKSCNYPNFDNHHKMHETFTNTYLDLKSKYLDGEDPLLLMKISKVALTWLKDHIRVQDQDFAKHFKAQSGNAGVGAAAETASATEAAALETQEPTADRATGTVRTGEANQPAAVAASRKGIPISTASRVIPRPVAASRPSPVPTRPQQAKFTVHTSQRRSATPQRSGKLTPIPDQSQFGDSKQSKYSSPISIAQRAGASRYGARPGNAVPSSAADNPRLRATRG